MNWSTPFDPLVSGRLCLALLHSLWQVAFLVVLVWIAGRLWRKQSVERTYALHVAALMLGVAAVPITYAVLLQAASGTVAASDRVAETVFAPQVVVRPNRPVVAFERQDVNFDSPAVSTGILKLEAPVAEEQATIWLRMAPWLAGTYACGVLLMLMRLSAGIFQAERLRRLATPITDGPLVASLRSLSSQWRVCVTPVLAQAEHLFVPKVVGLTKANDPVTHLGADRIVDQPVRAGSRP